VAGSRLKLRGGGEKVAEDLMTDGPEDQDGRPGEFREFLHPEVRRMLDEGVDFKLVLTLDDGTVREVPAFHSDRFVPPMIFECDGSWWAASQWSYGRLGGPERPWIEARKATPEEVDAWRAEESAADV
jgi:hypothetical protein